MKLLLACLVSLSVSCSCRAQSFIKTFSPFPDTTIAGFQNLVVLPDGGCVVSGTARSTALFFQSFLTRLTPDGSIVWSRQTDTYREPRALVALPDGSILFFNNNSNVQGYFDASVLRVSADGAFVSETLWGAPADQDDWYTVAQWPSGEVVAAGQNRPGNSLSTRNFLAKWSATGQLLWERNFDLGLLNTTSRLLLLPDGGFYMFGTIYDFGISSNWLAKIAPDGTVEWAKRYDYATPSLDAIWWDAVERPNGRLLILGYRGAVTGGVAQLSLTELDAAGAEIAQHSWLVPNGDLSPVRLFQPAPDTLLIAAVGGLGAVQNYDNDALLIQVRPDGTLLGTLALGPVSSDLFFDANLQNDYVTMVGYGIEDQFNPISRPLLVKTRTGSSCCAKSINVQPGAIPDPFVVSNLSFSDRPLPFKQAISAVLTDFPLVGSTSCASYEGVQLLGADTTICTGDSLTLGLLQNVAGSLTWNTGATTNPIAVTQPGTYTLAVSGECGQANDTLVVTSIGNLVDAQVSADASICPGESAVLEASGGSNYLWSPPLGLSEVQSASTVASPNETTTYSVLVASGQCRDSASVTVEVLPSPQVVVAPATVLIPSGGSAPLSASGADSYVWSPTNGLSCFLCANPVASPADTVTYTVAGTDANGCVATQTVTVNVQAPCPFYVPNAFYPDNDSGNGNDRFGVFGEAPTAQLLRVYDRWGNLVFESAQPGALWDGTFKSKPAPPGVYVYYLEITTCNGVQRARGDLTLVR